MPIKTETATTPAPAEGWLFKNLRREIDRLFDDFNPFDWRGLSRLPGDAGAQYLARPAWAITPAIDVSEGETAYEVTAELPGIDEKDIEIKLANHTLTIKGEKAEGKEEKNKDYYLSERRYGSFQRSFRVPDSVDATRIEASFAKGVLKVTLPKTADARQAEKKIEVKAA
jgi:HSP20 family protein